MYYIYIIECQNGALYTGITPDLHRRMQEHASRGKKGAKFTRANPPVALRMAWETADRSAAGRVEYAIKQLKRSDKLQLIENPHLLGKTFCSHLADVPCEAVIEKGDES